MLTQPCRIILQEDAKPIKVPPRRIPMAYHDKLKQELSYLEKSGIIEQVHGSVEWCAPIVLASKKNGDLHLCTDLRRLNQVIITHSRQIPTV